LASLKKKTKGGKKRRWGVKKGEGRKKEKAFTTSNIRVTRGGKPRSAGSPIKQVPKGSKKKKETRGRVWKKNVIGVWGL